MSEKYMSRIYIAFLITMNYFTQITNDVADRIEKALDSPDKPCKK